MFFYLFLCLIRVQFRETDRETRNIQINDQTEFLRTLKRNRGEGDTAGRNRDEIRVSSALELRSFISVFRRQPIS